MTLTAMDGHLAVGQTIGPPGAKSMSQDGDDQATLATKIKELQKASVVGKEMWAKFVVDNKHFRYDPSLHEYEFLKRFMEETSARPLIASLTAAGKIRPEFGIVLPPRPKSGGEAPGTSELVSSFAGVSPEPSFEAAQSIPAPPPMTAVAPLLVGADGLPPLGPPGAAQAMNVPAAFRSLAKPPPASGFLPPPTSGFLPPGGVIGAPLDRHNAKQLGQVPVGGVIGARKIPGLVGSQGGSLMPGQTIGPLPPGIRPEAPPPTAPRSKYPVQGNVEQYLAALALQQQALQAAAASSSSGDVLTGLLEVQKAAEAVQKNRDPRALSEEERLSEKYLAAAGVMGVVAAAAEEAEDVGEEMSPEVQQAALMAQQALMLQQIQFQEQAELWEKQKKEDARSTAEALQARPSELDGARWRPMHLCKQHFRGECLHGVTCKYAHSIDDLHPFSPEHPNCPSNKARGAGTNLLAETDFETPTSAAEPVMRMQRRQSMCQRHAREGCLLNERCPFAHTEADLGTMGHVIISRVKTQLCDFDQKGDCVYGKFCMKAHGMAEIGRPKPEYMVHPDKRPRRQ